MPSSRTVASPSSSTKAAAAKEAERIRALKQLKEFQACKLWTGSSRRIRQPHLTSPALRRLRLRRTARGCRQRHSPAQVSIFAGYPSERMFERWKPWGPGPKEVVKVVTHDPQEVSAQAREAIDKLLRDTVVNEE